MDKRTRGTEWQREEGENIGEEKRWMRDSD